MNIIVCVKQVPASNQVLLDPITNTIIREGAAAILNPFDAFAVEEAVRLKEKHGCRVAALCMGIPAAAEVLRETVALGADRAFLLSDPAFAGADTLATAYALSRGVIALGSADLIICGKMATDGDTAQVGPMLAEMLDIPHITDIAEIVKYGEQELLCRKLGDDGYQLVRVRLPALITVSKEINVPRLPSISGVLRGRACDIPVLSAADAAADTRLTGLAGSPTQVIKTFAPDLSVACERLPGKPAEQAAALLDILAAKNIINP